MTDYTYTVVFDNFEEADTIEMNAGDSLIIYANNYYGVGSQTIASSSLVGVFPPEIGKSYTFWSMSTSATYGGAVWGMSNSVVLNTPGTYTFRKARVNGKYMVFGEYLTVTVLGGSSSTIPVNVSGTWKEATPYVNVSGTWKEAKPYINVGGTWKETN